jgi:hypothetical protein
MYARDPRRALYTRGLYPRGRCLLGVDPRLCHRSHQGVTVAGQGIWEPSAMKRVVHAPPLASLASLSPRSRQVPTCPLPSLRGSQEVCKPRLVYEILFAILASVRSSSRRASLPPCTARHFMTAYFLCSVLGWGWVRGVPVWVRAVVVAQARTSSPTPCGSHHPFEGTLAIKTSQSMTSISH